MLAPLNSQLYLQQQQQQQQQHMSVYKMSAALSHVDLHAVCCAQDEDSAQLTPIDEVRVEQHGDNKHTPDLYVQLGF
jgi:hypothetical protein